jgi:hypothetical protein
MTTRDRNRAELVLIYAPGLVRSPTNTASGIAEVIAATVDRRRAGHYRAEASSETAPRGLRLGKSIIGPDGVPKCEVFELDYRDRLADLDSATGPTPPPSTLTAVGYGISSVFLLRRAWRHGAKAKSRRARLQLWLGLGMTMVLLAAAAIALIASLAALGLLRWLPGKNAFNSFNAPKVAVGAGGITIVLWAKARAGILQLAEHIGQCLRYLREPRHQDTVTQTLQDAIDGLIDDGWTAPIHVLGYSFGSLVVVDALFPRAGGASQPDRLAEAVRSLTTIGCPADTIQLYFPKHFVDRVAPTACCAWTNIFIPADVFASNFCNDRDDIENAAEEATVSEHTRAASDESADMGGTFGIAGVRPTCVKYTDETLSPLSILSLTGFRSHGGYWDLPTHASCFDNLVDAWVPDVVRVDEKHHVDLTTEGESGDKPIAAATHAGNATSGRRDLDAAK